MLPAAKARLGQQAAFVLLLAVMAFMTGETLFKPLPAGAMAFLLAVLLLPLAAFLPPLRRGSAGAALWLSMLLMPYFCWAVLGTFVPGTDGLLALLRSLLLGACFTALMLMVRWQRQAAATSS